MPNIAFVRGLLFACLALGLSLTATAAPPSGVPGELHRQAATEFAAQPFDRAAALQQRAQLNQWLVSETVMQGLKNPVTATFSTDETDAVDLARGESPVRVGLTRQLNANVNFGDLRMGRLKGRTVERANGAISGTDDGGFVYTMALSSPGAVALRVHFTGFHLPERTGVYLYTDDGQAYGPYTGRGPLGDGEFWSNTVGGDLVMLQLRFVGQASDADLHRAGFTIADLGHLRPKFQDGFCSGNASCVVDASCVNIPTAIETAQDAVAHMEWISGAWIYMCTGGLIADTDTGTTIPYFLTANHCMSRDKDARNLENFFQYETNHCTSGGSACPDPTNGFPRTLGANVVSTGKAADYTLLRLNEAAPTGSAYLGWNATDIAYSNTTELFRISHPSGSPQAYSTHEVDANAETCRSWPRGDRIYSHDTFGATEGGSSGSPVLNANGQIVGQLSGACGTNVNDVCDSNNNSTVDGAFAAYYDQVSQWLDPGSGGGSCDLVPEVCDNGIDDDCDSLIDAEDPDCQTSGGGQHGDRCLVDSDCASNKCTGKPGSMTCK
ncbi:MAG: serine protease [Lysobacterales bacterium]|jgi:hypothetical protein